MKPAVQEDHLPHYRVRPRFQVETHFSVDEIVEKISTGLQAADASCQGETSPYYTKLLPLTEEQHYWSPQLSISLESTDTGSLMRGLYGPRPAVWTMFVFFYSVIAMAVLVIGIIGLSNWTLDKAAPILWLVPVLIAIFFTLYLVAYFGQKLGHDQMVTLHQFLEKSTGLNLDASQSDIIEEELQED